MAPAPYSHPTFIFGHCSIGSAERVWFVAEDGDVSRMVQLNAGKWVQKSVPWTAVAVCGRISPMREVFLIGERGQVVRGTESGFLDEQIDPATQRPQKLGVLRDARLIAGVPHAVGMMRQVYRRGTQTWQSISDDILAKQAPVCGFNSIDGTSSDDLLTVGLEGEVWRFDGSTWTRIESPTNVALNRVRFADRQQAFACGQAGVLLEIGRGTVRAAADPLKGQNLYGLACFGGKVYAASMKAVFVLDGGTLEPVDLGLGDDLTAGYLETDGETLWSVGAHHLARTTDGEHWTFVKCEI